MDGLDLFVQVILALMLIHLLFGSRVDVAVELTFIYLRFKHIDQPLQAFLDRYGFEQFLFLGDLDPQVRRHRVGDLGR